MSKKPRAITQYIIEARCLARDIDMRPARAAARSTAFALPRLNADIDSALGVRVATHIRTLMIHAPIYGDDADVRLALRDALRASAELLSVLQSAPAPLEPPPPLPFYLKD